MSQTAAIPLSGMLDRPVLRGRQVTRSETVLAWSVAAIAALLLTAAVLFLSAGGRWFVVETPSMGEAARSAPSCSTCRWTSPRSCSSPTAR